MVEVEIVDDVQCDEIGTEDDKGNVEIERDEFEKLRDHELEELEERGDGYLTNSDEDDNVVGYGEEIDKSYVGPNDY